MARINKKPTDSVLILKDCHKETEKGCHSDAAHQKNPNATYRVTQQYRDTFLIFI